MRCSHYVRRPTQCERWPLYASRHLLFTARHNATAVLAVDKMSVCLSQTRVHSNKTKESNVSFNMSYER